MCQPSARRSSAKAADVLRLASEGLGAGAHRHGRIGSAPRKPPRCRPYHTPAGFRAATERTTACVSELEAVRQLHDAHPVVAALLQAVGERNLADEAWDDRFGEWEAAWRWAVAENWLRKRSDVGYRERLWQRRKETDSTISTSLGEAAALRAWTYFFNRLSHPEAAALRSWREAVRAIGRGSMEGRPEAVLPSATRTPSGMVAMARRFHAGGAAPRGPLRRRLHGPGGEPGRV
jgi:hypothetical protein